MARSAAQRSGLRGVGKLRRLLRTMHSSLLVDLRETIAAAAGMVLRSALRRVPRNEGTLARELRIVFGRDKLSARVGIIGARSVRKAYYAKWVEWGTSKRAAHPFLFPALEENMNAVTAMIDAAVGRTLGRIARSGSTPEL